jgi:DNA-binding LacI/PurR family transcriptional regulator
MKHTKGIPEVVTMREIAERAGVSLGTVSHVLNDSAAVRDVLRSRVMEAVKDLGYEPSQLARAFSRNSMDLVGMIVPDITNPFFPGVVRGAEDLAYQNGQRLVLCNTDNDANKEISYLADLRSFRSSGILIIPSLETRVLDSIRPTDPPVVFVGRCPEGWKGDFVVADNEKGGYLAARHLAQLGHRQYGVVTGPLYLNTAHARLEGFRRGLKEAGRKLIPEFIHEARYNSESGHLAAMRLLQMLPRPTAIFAANDLLAMGVLSALREMNLRCPEDVSLVGFDNLDIASYMAPALTTIHESGYHMGANACRLLLDRIKKRNAPVSRVMLPVELRVRDSTSIPPQAAAPANKKPAKK